MYQLKDETKRNLEYLFEEKIGIKFKEYQQLDFDEQQKLIAELQKRKKIKSDKVTVMIGSGKHAIFTKVKKGTRIMVGSGKYSCFVKAGVTPKDLYCELKDEKDDLRYSKPVAFVKKILRRLKK